MIIKLITNVPASHSWHQWFAWYPITIYGTTYNVDGSTVEYMVWWEFVWRKKNAGVFGSTIYEFDGNCPTKL